MQEDSPSPRREGSHGLFVVRIRGVEMGIGAAHKRPAILTTGPPTRISVNRQNRLLSAGIPLVEGIEGPILPEDCQDQN
jgi:hypothetical protein